MASAVLKVGRLCRKCVSFSKVKHFRMTDIWERSFYRQSPLLDTTPLLMPSLSPTMTEGTIVKWYKKEGDAVNPGDVLCDIQTDKAVVSMDVEEEGILAKILKPDNSTNLKVGSIIGLLVEEGDDWQNVEVPAETQSEEAPSVSTPAASTPAAPAPQPPSAPASGDHQIHARGIGPSVRKLQEEYHLNIDEVPRSGPHDLITKGDVINYIKSKHLQKVELTSAPPPSVAPPPAQTPPTTVGPLSLPPLEGEEFVDIPNTSMRLTIAKRLTLSKTTIPHSYVTIDCNVGPVTRLRKQLAGENVKVSVNDFIIKSAAIALQRVPKVNSVWQGDAIQSTSAVDISVAVATSNGLITPIVKSAANLGVDEISNSVKDLATRARENKLQLNEFQGGSFTISNLGMFGITEFSAVINPPQTAIMAIGSSRVVLGEDGKPESRMCATLSYDARVMDEAEASEFMEVFKDVMETPKLTIVGSKLSRALSAEWTRHSEEQT